MNLTPTDDAKRLQTPPLQGRGRGWGLSANTIAELQERARHMRNHPTEPEKQLWRSLSNSQLGGWKFRRQQVIGWSIADFVCPSAKLIVEVDGDTHDAEADALRDAALARMGYRTLRVTNDDVMRNVEDVKLAILRALENMDRPHPNPSPEGEGLEKVEAQKLLGISLERERGVIEKSRWPEHVILVGISSDHQTIFRSTDRNCDLHDSLCRGLRDPLAASYYLSVSVDHPSWTTANDGGATEGIWDEKSLVEIEDAIEEDFEFDDYRVDLTRVHGAGWPRSCSAIWKIEPYDAED